jgi:hypothetical protein
MVPVAPWASDRLAGVGPEKIVALPVPVFVGEGVDKTIVFCAILDLFVTVIVNVKVAPKVTLVGEGTSVMRRACTLGNVLAGAVLVTAFGALEKVALTEARVAAKLSPEREGIEPNINVTELSVLPGVRAVPALIVMLFPPPVPQVHEDGKNPQPCHVKPAGAVNCSCVRLPTLLLLLVIE